MKFLGRINVLKNGYELQHLETLKLSMLKFERMWKCGRGGTYFNDIFCVSVEIKNGPNWVSSGSLYSLIFVYVCVGYSGSGPREENQRCSKRDAHVPLNFNCFIGKMCH